MLNKQELIDFESEIDKKIKGCELLRLPLVCIITYFYLMIHENAEGRGKEILGTEKGNAISEAIIRRMSYLVPLLKNCTLEIGESAENRLSIFEEIHINQSIELLQYLHFCELMPEVYRDFYNLKK